MAARMMEVLGDLLAQRQEILLLLIGIVLAFIGPLADRYFIRRKRIHYRVQYNSKIGLSPVGLHDEDDPSSHADPRLLQYARMLDRMSIVIIRIRNTGHYDIETEDFTRPLSFTFGSRVVWDARISEATTPELRQQVRDHLRFFSHNPGSAKPVDSREGVGALRALLGRRLATWLGTTPSAPEEVGPQWHGVQLSQLPLGRQERFKLVVILREPDDSDNREITKEVTNTGTSGAVGSRTRSCKERSPGPARPSRWAPYSRSR